MTAIAPAVVGTTVQLFMLSYNSNVYYDTLSTTWGGLTAVNGATGAVAISGFTQSGASGLFYVGPDGQVYEWFNGTLALLP